jgi:ATP phosphoribosyltransferase regulatory subunit
MIPEGTRYHLPPEARLRRELAHRLTGLFELWGYELVEMPALEIYEAGHVLAERSFKLVDKTGAVLALRSDFTSALAKLLQTFKPGLPARFQYAGQVWLREADTELGRVREYTQFGAELIGVSSPEADAEVLELAWETLQGLGFAEAKIEVGLPSLVRDLLDSTGLETAQTEALRHAIHHKNTPELSAMLGTYGVGGQLALSIQTLPDLYGDLTILEETQHLSLSQKARDDLDWLRSTIGLLPGVPLLLDLGRARRLDYYTGINFQAYTQDFGLPLLGGGRYDGTLLEKACGFTVGLERVMEALQLPTLVAPPEVLALDRSMAAQLRQEGKRVELAHSQDVSEMRAYAAAKSILWLALGGRLEPL